jgi:adenylate cyclase, class 1
MSDSEIAPDNSTLAVLDRFLAINQARIVRAVQGLREKQRNFITLLPLFFEVSHPLFPGYVSREVPVGVMGYAPDALTITLARSFVRGFSYRPQRLKNEQPILALYAMGSAGTVGQSESSDFDIWICIHPDLNQDERQLILRRAQGIEKAAAEIDLEVHFFLVDPVAFRHGRQEQLSSESSGSAQHKLLLDEFYRTALLLAGQPPWWWLVPPEHDLIYDEAVADLKQRRFMQIRQLIDFGALGTIPTAEFFGAAIWQLTKGINSPYKSLLKLLLIEAYASDHQQLEPLSNRFKRRVYAGITQLDQLDPYLLMFEVVSDYLQKNQDLQRLEIARRCFYFKPGLRLSVLNSPRQANWQRQLLEQLVKEWGWDQQRLLELDQRDRWKIARVASERRQLFDGLTASYRFLSNFARQFAGDSLISQQDLNILGRKLFAAYERKAGKIELVNRGITATLHEDHLTFAEMMDENHHPLWHLYTGLLRTEQLLGYKPVKRSRSLTELIAWAYFNQILDNSTNLIVLAGPSRLSSRELRSHCQRIANEFPLTLLSGGGVESFSNTATLESALVVVNLGSTEPEDLESPQSAINANRSDPFNYGSRGYNLVQMIDLLLLNSWHEITINHFSGDNALLDAVVEYFKWYPVNQLVTPQLPAIAILSGFNASAINQRVESIFFAITNHFYSRSSDYPLRYLAQFGRRYALFHIEGQQLRHHTFNGLTQLKEYLGTAQVDYSPVEFDANALCDSPLPLIYRTNRAGHVQFYYQIFQHEAEIYILDERGSLFTQRIPFHDQQSIINQYSRFFEAVANRINFFMQENNSLQSIHGVEFYAVLGESGNNSLRLERRQITTNYPGRRYFGLQVIVEKGEDGQPSFSLYCEDREFTSLEYGKGVFTAVVRFVLSLRQGHQPYPIYITDIGLSRDTLGQRALSRIQTIQFLRYKQRIEDQLNTVLHQIHQRESTPAST